MAKVATRGGSRPSLDSDAHDGKGLAKTDSVRARFRRFWVYKIGPALILALFATQVLLAWRIRNEFFPLISLKEAELSSFLEAHDDGAFVYFHSPDCLHCQRLSPELVKAVRQVRTSEGKGAPAFASVNVETEPAAAEHFSLTRVPAVAWIRKNELVQQLAPTSRTVEKIVEFISWVRQPAVVEFETRADFDAALPSFREVVQSSPVIVGYAGFPGVYDALERAAHRDRGQAAFVYVKEVADSQDVAPLRSITRNIEMDEVYTQRLAEPESVKRWIKKVLRGLKHAERGIGKEEKGSAGSAAQ